MHRAHLILLLLVTLACGTRVASLAGSSDGGARDGGSADGGGIVDGGLPADGGVGDGGVGDGGARDGGSGDGGLTVDAGARDAGAARDGGVRDAGPAIDAGVRDAGTAPDAGIRDAGPGADAGPRRDGGAPDGGGVCSAVADCQPYFCGCGQCTTDQIRCVTNPPPCVLGCPAVCPELGQTQCDCSNGRCVRADGGPGNGACSSSNECRSGSKCCYPCGIPGCSNVCTFTDGGPCPLLP